jgi:DNA adenine methylase
MAVVKRPIARWHGGKWRLAPWITSFFPKHRIYVEPFCGAASILLRKQRSHSEVISDLDGEIVNVFRVLRDPTRARQLMDQICLTPYSRMEYEDSHLPHGDPIEQARRTILRSYMGYGSVGATASSGFRTGSRLSGSSAAMDWARLPDALAAVVERLRGVIIENRPAVEVLKLYDAVDALHYCDPPYLLNTRVVHSASNAVYRHEMSEDDHRELAETLHRLRGMVVLSGYASDLYDKELYVGWQRFTTPTRADSGAARTEVLWISPNVLVRPSLELGEI